MSTYICNIQPDEKGIHEIHVSTCSYLPSIEYRLEVGVFYSCKIAIITLDKAHLGTGLKFKGCPFCCLPDK